MPVLKLLDEPSGKRVFLLIQNLQNTTLPAEDNKVGIAFDAAITDLGKCAIILYPGAAITFDKTVPQNKIFVISSFAAPSDIPIGVTVSNQGG